jgi:hypothetical protein
MKIPVKRKEKQTNTSKGIKPIDRHSITPADSPGIMFQISQVTSKIRFHLTMKNKELERTPFIQIFLPQVHYHQNPDNHYPKEYYHEDK